MVTPQTAFAEYYLFSTGLIIGLPSLSSMGVSPPAYPLAWNMLQLALNAKPIIFPKIQKKNIIKSSDNMIHHRHFS